MAVLSKEHYTVGWICALAKEMVAAKHMLDESHDPPEEHDSGDSNMYEFGSMCGHNIVICWLPKGVYGTTAAARVVANLLRTFRNIRFGLLVGIAGGVPSKTHDVRLGDVVVSIPGDGSGGVIPHDVGQQLEKEGFVVTGSLNKPPEILLKAVSKLEMLHTVEGNKIHALVEEMVERYPRLRQRGFAHDAGRPDHLYDGDNETEAIEQNPRPDAQPVVHYGRMASGNQLIKDRFMRDLLGEKYGILCFEMEAAGVMDDLPCLVIRGISDYADSHKNKLWQEYAAAVAAGYGKELLSVIPKNKIHGLPGGETKFRVPFDLTHMRTVAPFIGREQDLQYLWANLQPGLPSTQKVVILHGLAGIGKTQLAKRFASLHKDKFSAIFWLNGKISKLVHQSLALMLDKLPGVQDNVKDGRGTEEKTKAKAALEWLSQEGNSKWLLIIDNFDWYSASGERNLVEFLPTADHGSILITTRALGLANDIADSKLHSLRTLSSEESVELLTSSVGPTVHAEGENRSHIHALAERLDGLPLALVIAGSFVGKTGISPAKYLQLYSESNTWKELQEATNRDEQYPNGNLLCTLMISYNQIQEKSPPAARLLILLSLYSNRDVWYDLVRQGVDDESKPTWLADITSSEIKFSKTVGELLDFAMIESTSSGNYSMHPVVQDWCRSQRQDVVHASKQAIEEDMELTVLRSVSHSSPPDTHPEPGRIQQRLLPHANEAIRNLGNEKFGILQDEHVELMLDIDRLYSAQGNDDMRIELFTHLLHYSERTAVADHEDTLVYMHMLGSLYVGHDNEKSAQLLHTVLAKTSDRAHEFPLFWHTVCSLGLLYIEAGEWGTAERLLISHLAKFPTRGSEDTFDLAKQKLTTILGFMYIFQGRSSKLEDLYPKTIINQPELIKTQNWPLAIALILGVSYINQNKVEKAEEIRNWLLTTQNAALGSGNEQALITLQILGCLYYLQGQYEAAEAAFREVSIGYERLRGLVYLDTLRAMVFISLCRLRLRTEDSKSLAEQVIASYQSAFGPENPATLDATHEVGYAYLKTGNWTEAEPLLQSAHSGYVQLLGWSHIKTIMTALDLGNIYMEQDRLEEADKILQHALAGCKASQPFLYIYQLQAMFSLARVHRDQGNLQKVRDEYRELQVALEEMPKYEGLPAHEELRPILDEELQHLGEEIEQLVLCTYREQK